MKFVIDHCLTGERIIETTLPDDMPLDLETLVDAYIKDWVSTDAFPLVRDGDLLPGFDGEYYAILADDPDAAWVWQAGGFYLKSI